MRTEVYGISDNPIKACNPSTWQAEVEESLESTSSRQLELKGKILPQKSKPNQNKTKSHKRQVWDQEDSFIQVFSGP
jgi:hypothetical protein